MSDDIVFQFITTPPVSKYFSDVVCRLRKQCLHLDTFLQAKEYGFEFSREIYVVLIFYTLVHVIVFILGKNLLQIYAGKCALMEGEMS